MKQKSFVVLMAAVFGALLLLVMFVKGLPAIFSSGLAFPFELLGEGLRALALTGKVGNGAAIALCAALSLLPALSALRNMGKKGFLVENIMLCCTSVVVFIILYGMANPSLLLSVFPYIPHEFLPVVKGIIGGTAWSFIVLWAVLRLARMFRTGDTHKLLGYLRAALHVLCLLFVSAIAVSCGSTLLNNLASAQGRMDGVIAVLRFIAVSLPYVLDIGITLSLLTLLDAYIAGNEEDTVRYAGSLSRRCCLALGIAAASTAVLNVIQLILCHFLTDISVKVDIPVVSLAFILLILILSRLVVENRRLQSDNDLFI